MSRDNYNDLIAFIAVARERSFTRAAARMGVTPSALSHAIRTLEERLGTRLLTRTTRSVTTTDSGETLYQRVAPMFEEIDQELTAVAELRQKPVGTVRINAAGHAAETVLWPRLQPVLQEYPDIRVEITIDYGLTDVFAQRYDCGVRLGDQVARDMIAMRIGPDLRMAVVATPAYFRQYPVPQDPRELVEHNCINLRLPTHDGLLPWDFEKDGKEVVVRVSGQWTFNRSAAMREAALSGAGMAFLPEDMVLADITAGRLQRVLDDWCDPFLGYHLYYPNRRRSSGALSVILEALRYPA